MSDVIRIKLYVNTGFSGASHCDFHEIDRSEWEAMTQKEQEETLDELAKDYLANCIDFGAYVVEE